MAIKIGHAALGEGGKVRGGQAGDQTAGEVCFRSWYNRDWKKLLRAKDPAIAEKMAKACEAGCRNENIGYDQDGRNSAHTAAQKVGYDLSKINTPCETDCSAFMTLCALAAGVKGLEYTTNAPTTSTMTDAFLKTGMFDLKADPKYLKTDAYVRRGDILVAPGKHTVMVLEDGSNAEMQPIETKKVSYAVQLKTAMNVRTGMGKEYASIMTLPKGFVVAICEEANGWGRITDIQGWISLDSKYVTR